MSLVKARTFNEVASSPSSVTRQDDPDCHEGFATQGCVQDVKSKDLFGVRITGTGCKFTDFEGLAALLRTLVESGAMPEPAKRNDLAHLGANFTGPLSCPPMNRQIACQEGVATFVGDESDLAEAQARPLAAYLQEVIGEQLKSPHGSRNDGTCAGVTFPAYAQGPGIAPPTVDATPGPGPSTGTIVGLAAGIPLGLAVVGAIVFVGVKLSRRRARQQRQEANQNNPRLRQLAALAEQAGREIARGRAAGAQDEEHELHTFGAN